MADTGAAQTRVTRDVPVPVVAVSVSTEVAAELYQHLLDQNRQHGSVRDLESLLVRAIERQWGTVNARRFNDKHGGGWLVDMSSYFDKELLYGLVRSSFGGTRMLVAVVDADDLEKFSDTGEWQSSAARRTGLDNDDAEPPSSNPSPRAQAAPDDEPEIEVEENPWLPTSPVLVIVREAWAEKPGNTAKTISILRATRSDVPGMVKLLLAQGAVSEDGARHPVTEDMIEVWSSMSRPKVEVRF